MRKLLLASTAMLGAATGIASAQAPAPMTMSVNPTQGMMAAPYAGASAANNTNQYVAQPSSYAGNKAGFAPIMAPAPGTIVIHLNGKVEVDFNGFWTTGNTGSGATGTVGGAPFKVNPVNIGAFMRLYPGVDGMATNGLRYGASIELRENFGSGTTQTTSSNVGAGALGLGTGAASPSGTSSAQTVMVRRAFTYFAADNVGMVRLGTTDGVIGLFDPCIYSAQCWDAGIGNFNGGMLQAAAPGAAVAIPFAWLAQAGAEYDNVKIVYLSPQFGGVDFGVQYAPSMGNGYSNSSGAMALQPTLCNQASVNCVGLTTGTDGTRWYNQVAVGARYQGNWGPLTVGVYGVWETASKESVIGGGVPKVSAYSNLNFFNAATFINYDTGAGQVTYSIDYIGGNLNGQLAMRPSGGAPENAVVTGFLYRNGPITLGAEAGLVESQGSIGLAGVAQRHEAEVAFGGNYNIAPGVYLVGEYMYTYRHQGGFNFSTGAVGTTTDGKGQGIMFSTVVNW